MPTPAKFQGIGSIFNVTDKVCLSTQSEFSIGQDIETTEIPVGDTMESSSIEGGKTWSGRFGFRDMSAEIVAAMIGGTITTGAVKWVSREECTVATGSVTLDNTPAADSFGDAITEAPIGVLDSEGLRYTQVTETPAEGEFKDDGDGTLSFHTSANDKTVYVSYPWADAAAGATVKPSVGSGLGSKVYLFAGRLYSTETKTELGYFVCIIRKLQRKGGITFGTTVKEVATFGFDFSVTVEVPDDLQMCFPVE